MVGTERAGLTVVSSTLREDYSHDNAACQAILEGVRGSVEIEVTNGCILQPDMILEVAELMAGEEAYDTLPRSVEILSWAVKRVGNRVTVKAGEVEDIDPDTHLRRDRSEFARSQRPTGGW